MLFPFPSVFFREAPVVSAARATQAHQALTVEVLGSARRVTRNDKMRSELKRVAESHSQIFKIRIDLDFGFSLFSYAYSGVFLCPSLSSIFNFSMSLGVEKI